MSALSTSRVHGHIEPGYEPVAEEFERNFTERGEVGAACAIYHHGKPVIDIWGGLRDVANTAPWEEDTLVCVFSVSKGMAATAMAVAHSRGLFELDQPMAKYWPEFAQNGKADITVRQLFAHQAGLCSVDEPLNPSKISDPDLLAAILARQRPAWKPGTRCGYHAFTLGWYQSELLHRVDPQHRRLARYFADEIARPLGVEFYFGVPAGVEEKRIAVLASLSQPGLLFHMRELPKGFVPALFTPFSLTRRTLMNPKMRGAADVCGPQYRSLEIPSANGIGQVRAIARVYGSLSTGGAELGITAKTMAELKASPRLPTKGDRDLVLKMPMGYAFGFSKPSLAFPYGSSDRTFGALGAGGAAGFADPDAKIGFAYATNKMGYQICNDPRERALRDALYASLAMMERARDFAASGGRNVPSRPSI